MGYDDVIPHLGGFGKYQKRIYFLICLPAISCAFHKLAGVFLLAKPTARCTLPFEESNASFTSLNDHMMLMSYPFINRTSTFSECKYFDANFTNEYFNMSQPNITKTISCSKWTYNVTEGVTSTVTEWDLVCTSSWLRATSDSMFMVGVMLGSIIFGDLSDRYGRRPIFFASLVIQVIFGVLAGIAPEYVTYTISRLVVGATTSGVFLVAYVLSLEMVGPKHRLNAGVIIMLFFSFGYVLTAAFAYFITDWRWLQISITLPGVLFLCYWWFIPESARWLLSNNRKDEAKQIIQKAAKVNKVNLPDDVLENLIEGENANTKKDEDTKTEKASILDLFKNPNLRRKSLFIFFNWFVNSGTYYGLSWNTNNLGGHVLLNFLISGAVEFPAYTFLLFTLNRWGRKSILCGSMLIAGTALLLTMAVPNSMQWLVITLAMIGKLAITASYGTIYIFSAEQFPTVIRNVGMGAASTAARIGGILAPYCNLLADLWQPLPLIIFGALAFIGGLMSLFLPETHNKTLPETIEDGENFGKKDDPLMKKDEPEPIIVPAELKPLNENGVSNNKINNDKY